MIADDLALALDPVALARALGIDPDPWQRDLLRSDAQQILMNCSRQSGKSTTAAVMGLHAALYDAPTLVLLLSPSLRQSSELFRKLKDFYSQVESSPASSKETALTLELVNGSRVVSLPGKESTVRGFSDVGLLVVDEAARVPDDLYHAVRPMLAVSGGRLVALSTPFGKRGFFYREWADGKGWHRVEVTAYDCPRIDAEWLEAERDGIGDWWYRQEYGCEFVESEDQIFEYAFVMAAVREDVEPLF